MLKIQNLSACLYTGQATEERKTYNRTTNASTVRTLIPS